VAATPSFVVPVFRTEIAFKGHSPSSLPTTKFLGGLPGQTSATPNRKN